MIARWLFDRQIIDEHDITWMDKYITVKSKAILVLRTPERIGFKENSRFEIEITNE